MEYAKDISFNIKNSEDKNMGQIKGTNLMTKCILKARKHKLIVSIIAITILMIIFDCFLIANFINILSTL